MNNLDKFFESKLSEHTVEPGDKAWSRIAANLPKKNNTVVWFRAAAGIAIAGLALMLWFYSNTDKTIDQKVAQQTEQVQPLEQPERNQDKMIAKTEESNAVANQRQKPSTGKKAYDEAAASHNDRTKKEVSSPVPEKSNEQIAQLEPSTVFAEQLEKIDLTQSTVETAVSKPIVIVFELKEIKKKENPYELDLSPQKKSGIKKVLEIANDVRTGESPLNGLRQAKEEIFAFNFKKEDKNVNK